METYSEKVEIGKKKVKITLEFPYTVDPKDADRFEHMLKEVYLNKIQKGLNKAISKRYHSQLQRGNVKQVHKEE